VDADKKHARSAGTGR
jgi:hypothetical protein